MHKVTRLLLVSTLLLGCVGCDQVSKDLARNLLGSGASFTFFGDTFRLIYAENPGVFLSLGATLSEPMRVLLFQGVIGIIIATLLWVAALRPGTPPWTVVGITLLAASGLGNLIDRLLYDGRVTDFLNLGIGGFRTGIFNVADVVGFVGVGILLFMSHNRPTFSASVSSLDRRL